MLTIQFCEYMTDATYGFFFFVLITTNCSRINRGCPRGIIVKAMDCEILASSNSIRAITFTFGQIPWGKVLTPLSYQLWVK